MMENLPPYALDYFVHNKGLHWLSLEDHEALVARWTPIDGVMARRISKKLVPFSQLCGWRTLQGRGVLCRFSRTNVASCDVIAALEARGAWPWETGNYPPWHADKNDADAMEIIKTTWMLDNNRVVWRVSPHPSVPIGSLVKGVPVYGREEGAVSRRGVAYLITDVKHVLRHGGFPCALPL